MLDSTQSTALVTGANRGVGALIAARFAEDGMEVISMDRAFDEAAPDRVTQVLCDLGDESDVARACREIADAGHMVSVLVNCAAVFGDFRPTHEISVQTWDSYLDVNARGPFLLMRHLLPGMVAAGFGRIVNVASVSSVLGGYRQAHYAASKAALIALSNTVANEYAPVGITSNCVLPGVIDNPQLVKSPSDVLEGALRSVPARRWAHAHEIVDAVEFLARAESAYINGVSLPVDGGTSLLQLRFSRDIDFGQSPREDS